MELELSAKPQKQINVTLTKPNTEDGRLLQKLNVTSPHHMFLVETMPPALVVKMNSVLYLSSAAKLSV